MTVRRESAIPLGFFNSHNKDPIPQHLADTVVEDLAIGEYRVKYRIKPVIFIRIYNWRDNLTVLHFNPTESGSVILSDYREIVISDEEIEFHFDDISSCRIVLIGDKGYSSFKCDF